MYRNKVLFIGGTRYSNPLDIKNEKKIRSMSKSLDMTFIALHEFRGAVHFVQNARFFLISSAIFNYLRHIYFLWYAYWKGRKLIKNESISVVICQSPFEAVCGVLLKKCYKNLKLIIEIHGEWDMAPIFYGRLSRFLKWFSDLVGRWAINRCDALRAVSQATLNRIRSVTKGQKLYRFPAYTDIEMFLKTRENRIVPNRFIFIGELLQLKGLSILIESVGILKKRSITVEVLLVGEGRDRKIFSRQVKKMGLKHQIIFLGKKMQPEIARLIKTAAALILPSFSEGFGRVIIEAFACSRPVIGSRVGAIPELVKDGKTGLLVEPGNVTGLANKMSQILQNPVKAKRMGQKGRWYVKDRFSTNNYVNHYHKMIKEVLKDNS